MAEKIFLGIDIGTQGLSVVVCDSDLKVIATGEGDYQMVPDQQEGHFLQNPEDWVAAVSQAMKDLHQKFSIGDPEKFQVAAIGISGQMHGEVLLDQNDQVLCPARLWCDSRNEEEEKELTAATGVKMPKRMTSVRWLWTQRNQPEIAAKVHHITTPGGYLAFRLTGQWNLGVGDASGMFPVDISTGNYDRNHLECYDTIGKGPETLPLFDLLPQIKKAGEDGGNLSDQGSKILGLRSGIPVAPAEGDQPAALAGSLIASPGMISLSFGTSVCANSVGEKAFEGVSRSVDHFCAADGRPINMIWLRNGTTFMNRTVELLGSAAGWDRAESFKNLMPKALAAPVDCEGILAIPFLEDEPGLNVSGHGAGGFTGLGTETGSAGSLIRASILSTIFNLRIGTGVLDDQNFDRIRLILTGGLTRTPEIAQWIADVFQNEVIIPESGDEGSAWGAAVLAKYRYEKTCGETRSWQEFLQSMESNTGQSFQPSNLSNDRYDQMLGKYRELIRTYQDDCS